ncbi:MAG TPA: hypothetical protein VN541_10770 [Tepidisphaeraceae bacterium]|nr:hypothetical protein [Tepidisphaeraceae bacterium]
MQTSTVNRIPSQSVSPIEQFLRDYVAARGGEWDELEPQVYDVLIDSDLLQVAFDPEALPERPDAQLAAFGSPLVDRLLADAGSRWNSAACYRTGVHLDPFNLESRVARAIAVPVGAAIQLRRKRAMHFPLAVFWFRATFTSDQREEIVLPIGIDLHELREVRQLENFLTFDRLSPQPQAPLPEAPHRGVMAGYRAARAHAIRSVTPLANSRRREWAGAVEKQIARMRGYYARLRDETAASPTRAADPAAAEARLRDRRQAIDREEQLRIAELHRKADLRVEMKLIALLTVYQPKLLIAASVVPKSGQPLPIQLVWDPQINSVDAVTCPSCLQPTFQLLIGRKGLHCPHCNGCR